MEKGAIFDMDGLLLDTEKIYQEGWINLAPKFVDKPNHEVPKAVSGASGEQVVKILKEYYPNVNGYEYLQSVINYYERHVSNDLELKSGVIELLEYFKEKGVKMAVASSTSLGQIYSNLKIAGIDLYFDAIVSGLDVKNSKPAPDIFLEAASRLDISPSECYVFEDAINGVKAGLAACCKTVMIPESQLPEREFYTQCTGIYTSLVEALDAIKKNKL